MGKMMSLVNRLLPIGLVLLGLTLSPAPAFAHSVQTDYRLVAGALELQSTFTTGEALAGAEVTVYAPHDPTHSWLSGVTDPTGTFVFQPDRTLPGEWIVKIGQGDHGDELAVPVSEQGVKLDAISRAPYEAPHQLASQTTSQTASQTTSQTANQFARQMVVMGILLGSSLGTTSWLRWRRRWQNR
jgi:nickel transport protein